MATRRGTGEYNEIQGIPDMQENMQTLHRVMSLQDNDPNGLVSKVKQLAHDLSFDGTKGMKLYEKVATVMMTKGIGSPRDAFPEVYADILEERSRLLEQNKESLDQLEASSEERNAWATGQQYQEVDADHQPGDLSQENLSRLNEQQAMAEKRMGGILQRLAKGAMDKVVNTMVAFDNSIDAVAAKSQSMWSSVTDAIKSKKTKMAALAATAIVAAGLTGNPAQAADVAQADMPTTHAEMMQSMHEGRLEQMEQDIQKELRAGMHQARADHMEQQINQEAMNKFSSNLQSVKTEAVDYSAGIDEAKVDFEKEILHRPEKLARVLDVTEVREAALASSDIRQGMLKTDKAQQMMDDYLTNPTLMMELLNDPAIKAQVLNIPGVKRIIFEGTEIASGGDLSPEAASRMTDAPGMKETMANDVLVADMILMDDVVQDRLLDLPEFKEPLLESIEVKKVMINSPDMEQILSSPDIQKRVVEDIGKVREGPKDPSGVRQLRDDIPKDEVAPKLQDNLNLGQERKLRDDIFPEEKEHKLQGDIGQERKLQSGIFPEEKEHKLQDNLNLGQERHLSGDAPSTSTLSYDEIEIGLLEAAISNDAITPGTFSNWDTQIDANSLKYMVEEGGSTLPQFLGELEDRATPEFLEKMKAFVDASGMEWDTKGYSQDNDTHYSIKAMSPDMELDLDSDREKEVGYSIRG